MWSFNLNDNVVYYLVLWDSVDGCEDAALVVGFWK